jgi:hypothetical protein
MIRYDFWFSIGHVLTSGGNYKWPSDFSNDKLLPKTGNYLIPTRSEDHFPLAAPVVVCADDYHRPMPAIATGIPILPEVGRVLTAATRANKVNCLQYWKTWGFRRLSLVSIKKNVANLISPQACGEFFAFLP